MFTLRFLLWVSFISSLRSIISLIDIPRYAVSSYVKVIRDSYPVVVVSPAVWNEDVIRSVLRSSEDEYSVIGAHFYGALSVGTFSKLSSTLRCLFLSLAQLERTV